jgi:hypothetical protein
MRQISQAALIRSVIGRMARSRSAVSQLLNGAPPAARQAASQSRNHLEGIMRDLAYARTACSSICRR